MVNQGKSFLLKDQIVPAFEWANLCFLYFANVLAKPEHFRSADVVLGKAAITLWSEPFGKWTPAVHVAAACLPSRHSILACAFMCEPVTVCACAASCLILRCCFFLSHPPLKY